MSLPDRNNPYSFQPFLDWRDSLDYYAGDELAQKIVRHFAGPSADRVDSAARALSRKASTRWRDWSNAASSPEKRVFLRTWDAHHQRVDQIVRPAETESLEREVFSEGLFSSKTDLATRLAKMFLVYQNGEACIACPLVCTEGMVALLERFADRPETKAVLEHVKEGKGGDFAVGAQFLTEIQGGSDVPANVLEAVEEKGGWRLYGSKFFCSVAHADYAVITAKPKGSDKVGLFVVSLWRPGGFRQRRGGVEVDRLKWKMGTSELPTAEMTFDGVTAWPLGPLNRGVANVVSIVLTLSRLTVGLASAGFMTRAVREAAGYARFREAFGRKIGDFPMVQGQLERMTRAAQRTTAGAFKLYKGFYESGGLSEPGSNDAAARRRAFDAREMVMLQKFTAAEESTDVIREAMAIFGGNGVIEDFSCLPRLYRDSAVNELWEGPRNVLQAQVHRDLQKAAEWYPTAEVVASILAGAEPATVRRIAQEMSELVAHPSLLSADEKTLQVCQRWDAVCRELVRSYQEVALREVERS